MKLELFFLTLIYFIFYLLNLNSHCVMYKLNRTTKVIKVCTKLKSIHFKNLPRTEKTLRIQHITFAL